VRSYRQFCGLARALDVVGERWTLLVVRELLGGPKGYNQLLDGLPGIATNLLADRLRSLADAGVVSRLGDGRYELTAWGAELRDAVYALGRWAGPLMAEPRGDDHFRLSWLHHMVIARFDGHDPDRTDLTVELCTEGEVFTLESLDGRVRLREGRIPEPDVILTGPAEPVVAYLLGRIDAATARASGVSIRGQGSRLAGLRPRGERKIRTRSRVDPRVGRCPSPGGDVEPPPARRAPRPGPDVRRPPAARRSEV
jgi:DNA-binding HxlR family transcriptional regulator